MSDSSSISVLWYTLERNEFLFPVLVALLLATIFRKPLDWISRATGKLLSAIGRRPVLSCVLVFLLVIGIRIALLPWVSVPRPWVHDEFSQLLLGETLAHGRLTNPSSPLWVHFETYHVNMLPTYQSMYMPAQGIFLAIGMVLFHSAWVGLLLSVGTMCAAYLWCFRGWMPPAWAMLGALITVLTYCSTDYWMNSYFGGAVAATGGAFVLGAYGRIWKKRRALQQPGKMRTYGALMGLGLLLLANSRPYEGFVYSIPFAVALLWWIYKSIRESSVQWRPVVVSLALVMVIGLAGMMFYFWRSTGSPLKMPYSINQEQYHPTRPFVWQDLRDVHYNHPVMEKFYNEWEMKFYTKTRTMRGVLDNAWVAIFGHLSHFIRWMILPFLVGAVYAILRQRWRMAVLASGMMLLGMSVVIWRGFAHYAAPAAPALLLICLLGLRWISVQLRSREHLGLRFARGYVATYLILIFTLQITFVRGASVHPYTSAVHRDAIINEMNAMPGKHLILVRYGPSHEASQEWVYNGYDLENGKVLWAREMGDPEKNRELMKHYAGRHFWLIEPDRYKAQPVPYPLSPE